MELGHDDCHLGGATLWIDGVRCYVEKCRRSDLLIAVARICLCLGMDHADHITEQRQRCQKRTVPCAAVGRV